MAARLTVWFTADVHDRRGFGKRLRALVGPDELLVDCGDSLRGSSTVYRADEGVGEDFACAPYRAQAVGNREFHYVYRWFAARARAMPMPLVCTNLEDLRNRVPSPFAPELTVLVAGLRVRLLAVLVPQYRTGSGWERIFGWRFLAPHAALARALVAPEAAGADITLLLSHVGLRADRALAASFPQLGAILGGHSHDVLQHPEVVGGVPIVHAGAYAHTAGKLELDVGGRRPTVVSDQLVPLIEGKP
jgi:2',3'-cyclic-nucleotide 2'-phosphodiesterase (5'-nucleotidase family)